MKTYRDNGAIGALLDEYERAIEELKDVISTISPAELTTIVDPDTKDPSCKSIQTILTHVVRAGNWYVTEVRMSLGEDATYRKEITSDSISEYQLALDDMFRFNEKLFEDHPQLPLEEMDNDKKIKVRWGQTYDVEQIFEHAIVHILRHRRQIERFLIRLR